MKSTSLVQQFFRHSVGSRRSRAVWLRSSWCSVTWHGWLWGGEMGACNGHLFSPDHQHQQPAKEEEAGRQAVLQKLPLLPFPSPYLSYQPHFFFPLPCSCQRPVLGSLRTRTYTSTPLTAISTPPSCLLFHTLPQREEARISRRRLG